MIEKFNDCMAQAHLIVHQYLPELSGEFIEDDGEFKGNYLLLKQEMLKIGKYIYYLPSVGCSQHPGDGENIVVSDVELTSEQVCYLIERANNEYRQNVQWHDDLLSYEYLEGEDE